MFQLQQKKGEKKMNVKEREEYFKRRIEGHNSIKYKNLNELKNKRFNDDVEQYNNNPEHFDEAIGYELKTFINDIIDFIFIETKISEMKKAKTNEDYLKIVLDIQLRVYNKIEEEEKEREY